MLAVLAARVVGAPGLETACGFVAQRKVEVAIDALDRGDGIGEHVAEIEIEEAALGLLASHLEAVLHAGGPKPGLRARDLGAVHVAFVNRAPAGDETAKRRQHFGRVPMTLHEAGVGIGLEHDAEIPHVNGVLEHPALLGTRRADELQHALVLPIRGSHVAARIPLGVRRNRGVAVEGVVGERLRKEVTALVGAVGGHQMDRLQARVEPVGGRELAHGLLEARIGLPLGARRSRAGRGRDPVLEHLGARILAEQMVKRRRARTRQPEHEHGPADRLRFDARIGSERALGHQSVAKQRVELARHHHATEGCQVRFPIVCFAKHVEARAMRRIAEVVEADGLARALVKLAERLAIAVRRSTHASEQAVQPVVQAHGQPLAAHGCWLLTATTSPVM